MIKTTGLYAKYWGAELLRLRLRKELSQKKVAAIVGISARALYDIEHGRVCGSIVLYECVVKAIGESFEAVRKSVNKLVEAELAQVGKKF